MELSCQKCVEESAFTQNVLPLLHEINHALADLLETGKTRIIDLRALPLAPGEETLIESILGVGEVSARLDALGPSDIKETTVSGVWLVTHYNTEKEVIGKFIEITRMPSLLETQMADIKDSLRAMPTLLAECDQGQLNPED